MSSHIIAKKLYKLFYAFFVPYNEKNVKKYDLYPILCVNFIVIIQEDM
jgi:hypothetical protein